MNSSFFTEKKYMTSLPLVTVQGATGPTEQKLAKSYEFLVKSPSARATSFSENDDSVSDSETESTLGSSFNDSISSSATSQESCVCVLASCSSWQCPNLRPVSLSPVVSDTSLPVFKAQSFTVQRSSSKLTELLEKSKAKPLKTELSGAKFMFLRRLPAVSQLNPLIAFSSFFVNYTILSGDQTDNKNGSFKEFSKSSFSQQDSNGESNGMADTLNIETSLNQLKLRHREHRVNCDFLKRYALDTCARNNGLLPNTSYTDESQRPFIAKFDEAYDLDRISEMSREKLWSSVILPPRKDACPRDEIDSTAYVNSRRGSEDAKRLKELCAKPSSKVSKCFLKPAGRLTTSACVKSKYSPTMGDSIPQYTLQGWQNKRWIALSI